MFIIKYNSFNFATAAYKLLFQGILLTLSSMLAGLHLNYTVVTRAAFMHAHHNTKAGFSRIIFISGLNQ
jgi:hypothetical protein